MDQYTYLFRDIPGYPEVRTSLYNTGGEGSIPDQGAKISYALCPKNQNMKQKQYCNKFNKDFKKWFTFFKNIF